MEHSAIRDQLETLTSERLAEISAQTSDFEIIRERLEPFPELESRATVGNLTSISETISTAARDIALFAVTSKLMTRKTAAELLKVHPHTISRWLTAAALDSTQQIDELSQ